MEHPDNSQLPKNHQFSVEDGLDQEIQRAIAQHDLEQQQLNEQSGSMVPEDSSQRLKTTDQDPHIKSEDNLNNLDMSEHHTNDGQVQAHNRTDTHSNEPTETSDAVVSGEVHHEEESASSQSAMDAAEEKRHLQMIADELKRATTSSYDDEPSQPSGDSHHAHEQPDETNSKHSDSAFAANTHSDPKRSDAGKPHDHSSSQVERPYQPSFIPADSELLATNSALAAYNALSSHVPSVASMPAVHLAALPLPIVCPDYLPARIQLLISSLPVLDNLASQLLRIFAVGPYQKIIDLASSPEVPAGAAFRDLSSLFEFTKRLYSEEDPFLTVAHLAPGMWKEGEKTPLMFSNREQTIESTLRKVNLATFLAATLGTMEVGFFHLNESFLDVFCPANSLDPANSMSNMSPTNMNPQSGVNTVIAGKIGKILKPSATLYLDLKTQAFISAVEAGERSSEEILEDILPSNLEQILLERRGVQVLTPTEIDFINRCKSRKETLLKYPPGGNLSEEFEWFTFLKDMFDFVSKNMSFLIWGKKTKPTVRQERVSHAEPLNAHSEEMLQSISTPSAPAEIEDKKEPIEEETSPEVTHYSSNLLPIEIQEQQIHLRINPRVTGKVPIRRPWTREEEKGLRHALELKGPAWATILELFGQGGRINEVLRNRTQVQLKDKARNWKMFFLKSGLPVPSYLQKVTGDLDREDKSRAKTARNKKTAAAPVPSMPKREGSEENEPATKRRKA